MVLWIIGRKECEHSCVNAVMAGILSVGIVVISPVLRRVLGNNFSINDACIHA